MNDNRVAFVTGSSRGIGRAIAIELANAGYDLAIHCRSHLEGARSVAEEVRRAGRQAGVFQADLAKSDDRRALLDALQGRYDRLDLLVNNAGAAPKLRADLLAVTEEGFDDTFDTNFKGPFFLTQAIARWMLESRRRHPDRRMSIINISSVSEYAPTVNRPAYCVAKAAVGMMNKLFAVRLAEAGINVNEIRPGIIETDMTAPVREKYDRLIGDGLSPLRRWGKPEDVARAVRALASGDFDFATAAVVDLDGGFHLRRL